MGNGKYHVSCKDAGPKTIVTETKRILSTFIQNLQGDTMEYTQKISFNFSYNNGLQLYKKGTCLFTTVLSFM